MSVSAAWARASQAEADPEPAGALDRVDQPEDVAQDRLIVRVLLEPDKLGRRPYRVLTRFGRNSRRRSSMTMTQTHKTRYSTSHCHRNGFPIHCEDQDLQSGRRSFEASCCRYGMDRDLVPLDRRDTFMPAARATMPA